MLLKTLASIACLLGCLFVAARPARAQDNGPAVDPRSAIELLDRHQYLYFDFAERLQGLNNEIALAEFTVATLQRRVASHRPFRSFRQYSAAYAGDQLAQFELAVARQELQWLRRQKSALWRERQMAGQLMLLEGSQAGQ